MRLVLSIQSLQRQKQGTTELFSLRCTCVPQGAECGSLRVGYCPGSAPLGFKAAEGGGISYLEKFFLWCFFLSKLLICPAMVFGKWNSSDICKYIFTHFKQQMCGFQLAKSITALDTSCKKWKRSRSPSAKQMCYKGAIIALPLSGLKSRYLWLPYNEGFLFFAVAKHCLRSRGQEHSSHFEIHRWGAAKQRLLWSSTLWKMARQEQKSGNCTHTNQK